MKKITSISFLSLPLGPALTSRSYVVQGDPGATFSIIAINEDNEYYNFPENTIITNPDTESIPAPVFSSTPARLKPTTIGSSGLYTGNIVFPAVTASDYYNVTFTPEAHYETELDPLLFSDSVYYVPKIYQYLNTSVTFSLTSTEKDGGSGDESYNAFPSNIIKSGSNPKVSEKIAKQSFALSWPLTLNASNFAIIRQPEITDFEFTTTKTTRTAGTSSKELELTNIQGLSVGMSLTANGIAGSNPGISTIVAINRGFKDINNSTTANPIYIIPKEADTTTGKLKNSLGGTVTIANASTFVVDRAITFTGFGSDHASVFNQTKFSISNFALVIDPVVTTTTAAVAAAATVIPVTSTNGIKDDVSTVSGIGINSASTMTVTNISSLNLTVRALVAANNEALESGQTVTFTGSSRSGTITADVKVLQYGDNNITLTLNLDNILSVE